jgi:hypothetical protein
VSARARADTFGVKPLVAGGFAFMALLAAGCGGDRQGAVSIRESARLYSEGHERMTIKGALVVEYGRPMLCSGVVRDEDPGTPVCESPAYWIDFGSADPGVGLQGDGSARWAESVSFRGTLNEGVFIVESR